MDMTDGYDGWITNDNTTTIYRRHDGDRPTAWRLHDDCMTTAWRRHDDGMTTAWRRHDDDEKTTRRRCDDDATRARRPSQAGAWHVISPGSAPNPGLWHVISWGSTPNSAYDDCRSVLTSSWPRRHVVVVMPSVYCRPAVGTWSSGRRNAVVVTSSWYRPSVVMGPDLSSQPSRHGAPASTRKPCLHMFRI